MKKSIQLNRLIMFAVKLTLIFIELCLFLYVWRHYYATAISQPFFYKGNYLLVLIYGVILVAFTILYGGYSIGYFTNSNVIYSQILSLLFVNIITYFQISLIGRALFNPAPMILLSAVEMIVIVLWVILATKLYYNLFTPGKMIVVYGNDSYHDLISKMNTRKDKYHICESVSIDDGLEKILQKISTYDSVIICDVKGENRNDIIKYCFEHSIMAYITPKISDILIRSADRVHLFDTPLLLCHNGGLTFEQRFFKRTMDIVLSIIILTLASPLMLIVALIIKIYDGGHVFFKQKRLTLHGKVFELYKFRSMVVDAESDGIARLSTQNDTRITAVGKIIRKTRIDEFPQLINVVLGDMSLVGPRPERPEIAEQYMQSMPEFEFRLKVKAGLTGYAQVLGKYNSTPYDKLKLDLMYIENRSTLLDLKLILLTLKILFQRESTEGIVDGNITADDINIGDIPVSETRMGDD